MFGRYFHLFLRDVSHGCGCWVIGAEDCGIWHNETLPEGIHLVAFDSEHRANGLHVRSESRAAYGSKRPVACVVESGKDMPYSKEIPVEVPHDHEQADNQAQTTISQPVRARSSSKEGDELAYEIEENRVILTKASAGMVDDPFATFREWESDADAGKPMRSFKQGDVIRVPFPYTDRSTRQHRPALVVSKGAIGDGESLLWVAMITSAENRAWPGDVPFGSFYARESGCQRRPLFVRASSPRLRFAMQNGLGI